MNEGTGREPDSGEKTGTCGGEEEEKRMYGEVQRENRQDRDGGL